MFGDSVGAAIGLTVPSPAADPSKQRDAHRAIAAYRRAIATYRRAIAAYRRAVATYRRAVEHHGAAVVELRPGGPRASLDGIAGLLLPGGGDMHPRHYGGRPHPKLGVVDAARDELELRLARAALSRGLPVLGICRGAQVLGVALGGELIQDIASDIEGAQEHASAGRNGGTRHWVEVAADSRLGGIVRAERIRVNTSHHQANGRLGEGVRPVAWSGDGVVEAIERDGPVFAIGVQWHPERMWRRAPRQRRLFAAFVAAARGCAGGVPQLRKG